MSLTIPTMILARFNANVSLPNIKALFLDLDETLLDGSQFGIVISGTCEAIARRVPALDADQLRRANSSVFSNIVTETLDDWTLGRLTGRELSFDAWRRTLIECDYADPSIIRFAAETHLRLARSSYQLFDDARQLIDAIDRSKVPVALITNGASDTQSEKLDAMGILDWFDVLVISGEHGVAKPDATAFHLAIKELGIEKKGIWHVGDNPETDVLGAQAAGLTGVWLNRNKAPIPRAVTPDLEITSLSALIKFLRD